METSVALEKRDPEVAEPAVPARKPRKRRAPPLPQQPSFERPVDAEETERQRAPKRKRGTKRPARKQGTADLTPRVHRSGNHRKRVTKRPTRA